MSIQNTSTNIDFIKQITFIDKSLSQDDIDKILYTLEKNSDLNLNIQFLCNVYRVYVNHNFDKTKIVVDQNIPQLAKGFNQDISIHTLTLETIRYLNFI